jgi:hypothetical protein
MMFWSFGSNGAIQGASSAAATTIAHRMAPMVVAG